MLLLFALLACDDHIFSGGAGHGTDVEGGDAIALLRSSCEGCHSDSLLPNFSGDLCENLVDVLGTQSDVPFVTAGDPEKSYIIDKIKGTATVGGIMPPTGQLSEAEIALVEQWIKDGATCDGASTPSDTGEQVEDTGGVPEDTGEPTEMEQSIPEGANVTNGNELVNQHCGICHVGGYAPAYESLIPFIDNKQIADAIQYGKGTMSAVTAIETEQEVNDIIGFLRTTYPANPNGGNGNNGGDSGQGNGGPDGEELANIYCNSCHINGYAPSFDNIVPYNSAQELYDIIKNGNSEIGMPAFPDLTDEEINALILYLDGMYNTNAGN